MRDKQEEYLKQLEDLKRRDEKIKPSKRFRHIRETYKKYALGKGSEYMAERDSKARRFLEDRKEVDPIEGAAIAYDLMKHGIEYGSIHHSLMGAELYEKIGKGEKAITRLLKAVERSVEEGRGSSYSHIKAFIKKNTGEREESEKGLELKFGIFAAFIIGGVALSLGSITITGNAVSNLTQTTPGLLGIILFIAGLVGMFFYFKGK